MNATSTACTGYTLDGIDHVAATTFQSVECACGMDVVDRSHRSGRLAQAAIMARETQAVECCCDGDFTCSRHQEDGPAPAHRRG